MSNMNIGPPYRSRGDLEAMDAEEKRVKKRKKKKAKKKVKKMVRPITPDEVTKVKKDLLPDSVIEAWNEVIAENWDGSDSHFTQDTIAKRIAKKTKISKQKVFDKDYLDVEDIYRAEGWKVFYDRPGYNETYSATFNFSRKAKK